ncbi:MAG: O-Antigen ligase [Syntrophorhabdus sp. PtaU1.Bin058]|nr:MAG: O-Antigen ligase [Syntrophorhabdus sp. PtaU1.Bin058]
MAALEKLFSIFVFFLIPFLGNNHLSLFYINIDKFWIETSFILVLIVAIFLQYVRDRETRISLLVFLIFFVPFMLINIISLVYTWSLFSTLWEINVLIWAGCSVSLYAFSTNREGLLRAIVLGTFVSSICAIVQFIVLFPNLFEVFQNGRLSGIVRGQAIPVSSFAYHNMLGGYFAFVLPVALYYGTVRRKLLYIIASSVIIGGVILTTSRISIAIVLLEVLFCIVLMLKEKNLKGLFSTLGILVLAGVCLYALFFTGKEDLGTGVRAEMEKKTRITQTQITTLNTRTDIWKNGIDAFKEKPVTGYGSGAFEYAYRKYFDGGVYTQYSHSVVTKILVELGLIGLLCAVWYLTGVIYGIRKSAKKSRDIFIYAACSAGILFAALDFAFDIPAFVITFFVFSFIMLPGSVQSTSGTGFKHVFTCLVIVLLISSLFFTVKVDMSKKSIDNGTLYLEGGFLRDAYYAYMDAVHEMPVDNEGRIKAINVLNNVYMHEKNGERKEIFGRMLHGHLATVERLNDKDSELFLVAGTAYALLGDKKKAEEYLLRAHLYYPSSPFYVFTIAGFYVSAGDIQKALMWTHKIDPYLNKYMASKNPGGLYVYRIRDIEANIYFGQGDTKRALSVARANLDDARMEKYTIASVKAREMVSKDSMIKYLQDRVDLFQRGLSPLPSIR